MWQGGDVNAASMRTKAKVVALLLRCNLRISIEIARVYVFTPKEDNVPGFEPS